MQPSSCRSGKTKISGLTRNNQPNVKITTMLNDTLYLAVQLAKVAALVLAAYAVTYALLLLA